MATFTDITGTDIVVSSPPERVVSLVPSITESIFGLGENARLVGRTRYCIKPDPLVRDIEKVGGTKDPDIARIVELAPDIVLANREENREPDIRALRDAGLLVHVDEPITVTHGLAYVSFLGQLLGAEDKADEIVRHGAQVVTEVKVRLDELAKQNELRMNPRPYMRPRVAVFIWMDPWMAVGGNTYIGDMIDTLGGNHVFRDHEQRYFETTPEEIIDTKPDILLFPDEPFHFKRKHADQWETLAPQISAVRDGRLRLCNGEDLCWFGTRIPDAVERLQPVLSW